MIMNSFSLPIEFEKYHKYILNIRFLHSNIPMITFTSGQVVAFLRSPFKANTDQYYYAIDTRMTCKEFWHKELEHYIYTQEFNKDFIDNI